MRKGNDTFMLWTDRDGNELHLAKGGDGQWHCVELAQTRADLERLLLMLADATHETDYAEVEAIGKRNGFEFDDNGEVIPEQ